MNKDTNTPAARKPRESAADKKARLAAEAAAAAKQAARDAREQAKVAAAAKAEEAARAARMVTIEGLRERLRQTEALEAALAADDGATALLAVETLNDVLKDVRRTFSTRKAGGPIGARTPKGEGSWVAVAEDGSTILASSNYVASTRRDTAMARKRIKDGTPREGDAALGAAKVMLRSDLVTV
jgi:hypothetical protein